MSAYALQVSASLDRQQVALNEQAVLSLTISGSGDLPQPQLPALPDFQVYAGGRAQSFSWVNGQASASITYSYVLTPLKEGKFTVPPIRVEGGGQSAETPALPIEVVKGDAAAIPAPTREPGRPAPRGGPSGTAAIFIQSSVDKTSAYVGEAVTFSFRLYNRVALLSQPRYQPPQTPGFWAEDLPPQRNYQTNVKGMGYSVTEVKTALFPTTAGKAQISPAKLSVHVENLGADPFSSDFFMSFFGRGEEKILSTEAITVNVKPLPEPKPANFKGAVGRYALSSAVDKDTVAVGEAVTLMLTVSGRGNIKALPDIEMPPVENFRVFPPNAATNIDKKDYQVTGSKIFRILMIPSTSGDLKIPSIDFSYFDPEAKQYKTLSSRAFTIHVRGGTGQTGAAVSPAPGPAGSSAPGIRRLADDIRHIKTPGTLNSQSEPLARQLWFLILQGLVFAALLGAAIFRLVQKIFLSDERLVRFKGAAARAAKSRSEAETAIAANRPKEAAEVLSNGLHRYVADKIGASERGLGLKDAMQELRVRGVHSHNTEKVRNLWEALDLYRFAPSQVRPEELRQASRTFEHIVDELEKGIVWKK